MRLLIVCLAASIAAFGQINGLAADSSGNDLLLITKGVRQPDSDQSGGVQLYRLKDGELSLLADDGTNLISASMSADGSVFGYTAETYCQNCGFPFQYIFHVERPGSAFSGQGEVAVSANGKYASVYGPVPGPLPNTTTRHVAAINLSDDSMIASGSQPASHGLFVADDGTLLAADPDTGKLELIGPEGTTALPPPPSSMRMLLAADASRIVYETTHGQIGVVNVAGGTVNEFAGGSGIALAADGRTFSYSSQDNTFAYNAQQIWTGDAAAGTVHMLADLGEDINTQTISADGLAVIAATAAGRLVKIDTITGKITELLPPSGTPMYFMRSAVPGSYNELLTSVTPDPDTIHVIVDGHEAPILGYSPRGIALQVPWEARAVPEAKVIGRLAGSPFEQVVPVGVSKYFVFFLPVAQDSYRGPWYFAVHEDWSGVVRPDSPVHPGEVIHMYSMGWGAVDGTLLTGQPTPASPLYHVAASCPWRAYGEMPAVGVDSPQALDHPLENLFSGLAPGLIGVFQHEFRVPADWSSTRLMLGCEPFVHPDTALVIPVQP